MTKSKGRNHKPLLFVAEVENVEEFSSQGVADRASFNQVDGGLLSDTFRVTVTRRGVTEEEETKVMELSKRNRLFASLIVDKAARQVGISHEWARRVALYGPYHQALIGNDDTDDRNDDRSNDGEEDPCLAPLSAAWRLLIQDIGQLTDSSPGDDNIVLQKLLPFITKQGTDQIDETKQEEFAEMLFVLCRQEFQRLAKPKPCSVTGSIGECQALVSTMMPAASRVNADRVCDVATVRESLASVVAAMKPPEGCSDLIITIRGAGVYSFSTTCSQQAMKKAESYLESAVEKANQIWSTSVETSTNDDEDTMENRRRSVPSETLADADRLEDPSKNLQPSLNVGLIGDVANGKSTMIRAMSGKRTQAHSSEQQKHGMTIRLGFANAVIIQCSNKECGLYSFMPEENGTPQKVIRPYQCGSCGGPAVIAKRISFTDCPGHAELMATMLAGASAFDAVIFAAAANTPCPSPQARQHLEALKLSQSLTQKGNLAVAQTKAELVVQQAQKNPLGLSADELLSLHSTNAKDALRLTAAADAPFFPVCAPLNVGLGSLASWMANLPSPPKRSTSETAHRLFNVLRSFDVNRPGTSFEKLVGGVIGGTVSGPGVFRQGDLVEVRPGLVIGKQVRTCKSGDDDEDCEDAFQVCPLVCRCEELMTGKTQLTTATAGGLVAFRTTLNPSLCADDHLVGAVVGPKDMLPPVWGPTLLLHSLQFVQVDPSVSHSRRPSELLQKGTRIRCHSGSATVPGQVLRVSARRGKLQVQLGAPLCAYKGASVAIEADVSGRSGFSLVAHAILFGGSCCYEGADAPSDDSPSKRAIQADAEYEDDDDHRKQFLVELVEKQAAPEEAVRISVPSPSVTRDGGSHVLVDNFAAIAASLSRDPSHLQAYMEREGGLSCARAGSPMGTSLRIHWRRRGCFAEMLTKIIRRYAASFIACQQCKGTKTELLKTPTAKCSNVELLCRQCNARRFVPKI